MQITLIYFAALRELVGKSEETIQWATPAMTVAQLLEQLIERRPNLTMQGVRVALNEEFVETDAFIHEGDVLAFIPPVSGG